MQQRMQTSGMLGLAWVLACAVGAAIATLAGEFLAEFVLGLTLGAAQWIVVRRYLHHPLRSRQTSQGVMRVLLGRSWDQRYGTQAGGMLWVLASAFGGMLGFMLSGAFVSFVGTWLTAIAGRYEGSAYGFVFTILQVAIIGVAQWLVLRAYLRTTGMWLVAAVLGALVFAGLSTAVAFAGNGVPAVVLGAVPGAGYGVVTAIALVRLRRERAEA